MRTLLLCILTILSLGSLKAQNTSPGLTFNHLALSVADVDRSALFYTTVLQLKETLNRANRKDMRWISLGGNLELHLKARGNSGGSVDAGTHFALATTNFDAFLQRLNDLHISFEDSDGKPLSFSVRADGVRQLYLQDPDGHWIEVNDIGDTKRR